ncbi:hypothetical protein ACIQ9K_30745 [Streptomyces microflavus]|uniref:hypothetical protein n=1 Tax=Streptomyces microflavus TaxID=1919 RepID=UPI0038171245
MLSTVANTRDPATWEKQIKPGGVANVPFVDFREGPEGDNCRASRNWAQHQVVQVVECAGQFKFAEHTPEPTDAFPAATWSSFTVVELDFAGLHHRVRRRHLGIGLFRADERDHFHCGLRSGALSQSVLFGADT